MLLAILANFWGFDRILKIWLFHYLKKNVTGYINYWRKTKICTIREFSKFVGKLVYAAPAVKYSILYTKFFEREKIKALYRVNDNYDAKMNISTHLLPDFSWWLKNIMVSSNNIHDDKFARDFLGRLKIWIECLL